MASISDIAMWLDLPGLLFGTTIAPGWRMLFVDLQILMITGCFWEFCKAPLRIVFWMIQIWMLICRQLSLAIIRILFHNTLILKQFQIDLWIILGMHLGVLTLITFFSVWLQKVLVDPDLFAIQVSFHRAGIEIVKLYNKLLGKIVTVCSWNREHDTDICSICLDPLQPAKFPRCRLSAQGGAAQGRRRRVSLSAGRPSAKKDRLFSTTCGHWFHSECMKDWVVRGHGLPRCPLCNTKMSLSETISYCWPNWRAVRFFGGTPAVDNVNAQGNNNAADGNAAAQGENNEGDNPDNVAVELANHNPGEVFLNLDGRQDDELGNFQEAMDLAHPDGPALDIDVNVDAELQERMG